ncbi:hypothetical protein CLOSTMETH_02656 [[Clostridium] methylpentosum DSM 5476]|uniref:Uncharacterized protein n=1 Tax=[Clostridium] methylpentosum DSM 5476 TaxID=537013 RepID=C0EFL4_9FIRM|nr:hypothetical protein CLOSTMETH_02656 [[Clostridium] methylpentosum DSM 5476]
MHENKAEQKALIDHAPSGGQKSLETLCTSVQDIISHLTLKMQRKQAKISSFA